MFKTFCSTVLIFSAISIPVSSASNIITASPYVMEQTEGNDVYRPLFYDESDNHKEENPTNKKLEYSNLIFTENFEYQDIFISKDKSFLIDLWSDYWTEVETLQETFTSPIKNAVTDE
tara:strand:- start:437 stop:790 length:354 start_codon:yes stop_codon:yes gene_type:complete